MNIKKEKYLDNKNIEKTRLFKYLMILSIMFLIWQILCLLFAPTGETMFGLFQMLNKRLSELPLTSIFINNFLYWGVQISLLFIFTVFVWGITRLSAIFLNLSWNSTVNLGFILWVLSAFSVLLANEVYNSLSLFSDIISELISYSAAIYVLYSVLFIIAIFIFLSILQILKIFLMKRVYIQLICVILIAASGYFYYKFDCNFIANGKSLKKPNVIIIGLDAIRPDRLGYFGYKNQSPGIDNFLSQATIFDSAITPQARTFTAWVSILTGLYPVNHHARFSLGDPAYVNKQETIGKILQKYGYQRVYAMDDRRFSNITNAYGFDKQIGVKEGIIDFIIGFEDDIALSNLVVNTRIGEYLFPYNFANRAMDVNYKPESFISLMKEQLPKNSEKPIFLSIHFCLPHWPYTWAESRNSENIAYSDLYDEAVKKIDSQFLDLMNYLKQKHFLDNAIVIVLSDHGESFGNIGDRNLQNKKYLAGQNSNKNLFNDINAFESNENNRMDISVGHGTDVLSISQSRSLLAFRRYGKEQFAHNIIKGNVSLVDIKPTLLDVLGYHYKLYDGESLIKYLNGKKNITAPRMIFIENGFSPKAIKGKVISVKNALLESIELFKVDKKTNKVIMDQDASNRLLKAKQRAVYYGDWMLALYPGKQNKWITILVNRKTKYWTDDLSIPFAKNSPSKDMMQALKKEYGKELMR